MDQPIANQESLRPFRGPFARWPLTSDTVLAVVLFLMTMFVASGEGTDRPMLRDLHDIPLSAILLFAIANGALVARRAWPISVLGAVLAVRILCWPLDLNHYDLFALMVALYSLGRYAGERRWSYLGAGAAILVAALAEFIDNRSATDIGFAVLATFLVWYIGRQMRARDERLRLLEERARQLERERDIEARRAASEERTRIAREMHDVVAHKVSLMTVQAGAAKTIAARDPDGAIQAMAAIEEAGRQALDELRQVLGVLRQDSDGMDLGPQPGFGDIPQLVQRFKETGLEATMDATSTDTAIDLPGQTGLAAYRIIQEALTNVLKHAGPETPTEIRLAVADDKLTIDVRDRGRGATILPGSGQGITGMRERAQLLGGTLEAGPNPDGGFRVRAVLPLPGGGT